MKKSIIKTAALLVLFLLIFSCKNQYRDRENPLEKNQTGKNIIDIKLLTSMEIEVGDPIDIVLSISSSRDSIIDYPKKSEFFKPLWLISYKAKKKIKGNKKYIYVYYTLTSYYSGKITLPSLTVYINKNPVKVEPIEIKVKSAVSAKKKESINDIVGPLRNNRFFIIFPTLIILAVIIILFFRKKITFLKKRKKGNVNNNKKEITYDPVLTSIISIYTLSNETGISIRDRYYILSDTLKKFMGEILNINIMPLTTNRIKRIVHKYLSDTYYECLAKKLDKYDEIKYSKKVFDIEYKNKLLKDFPKETGDLQEIFYQLLQNYYTKMTELKV